MSTVSVTCQDIYQQILELPQESLIDLSRYVEFLRFKTDKTEPRTEDVDEKPFREARREMWGNFPRDIDIDVPTEES